LILYTSGRSPNLEAIQTGASRLVYYNTGDINSSVSYRWTKAWIARNYEFLKQIREKPISVKRLSIHIIEDIKEHFANFDKYRRKWSIRTEDMSNFDKSGFQIGVVTGDIVYILLDCKVVYNTDPDNRELVIVVAIINYGRRKVPVYIIFKRVYHLCGYFPQILNGGIEFIYSPTGFTNNRLGLQYLKYFIKYCSPLQTGAYRILIFDRYGSYLSNEFLYLYWENCIRPFKLPVYTTHLL
jgi:hypothetical protein